MEKATFGQAKGKVMRFIIAVAASLMTAHAVCGDLDEVRQQGVLRHLGVPYANFVTGSGDGMDVEIVQLFARYLGVHYEYVKTTWENVVTACSPCNLVKGSRLPREAGMFPLVRPVAPSSILLQQHGRAFPPNYLHESWRDFLYWDTELDPV